MQILFSEMIRSEGDLEKTGIYKIVNKVNGKWYLGSTGSSFCKRFRTHRGNLRRNKHANPHLQNAYNKYGEKEFVFEILACLPVEDLLSEEQNLLDVHYGSSICYNISKDAKAPMRGRKHSEETKRKIQIDSQKRAKKIGEATRKRQLGTRHSSKTIKKMRDSAKSRDDSKRVEVLKSKEFREKVSRSTKGVPKPEEWKKKMEVIRRSREYRDKLSQGTKGVPKSEEWKRKASFARLGESVTLVNKNGVKEVVVSIRDFSKTYELNRKEVSKLIKGQREEYKGWELCKK